jgi:OOP family OmpA-OmpF porin
MFRSSRAALLVLAFAVGTPAVAQMGWYAGASLGQSKTDSAVVGNRESTVVNATVLGSDFDAKDTGYKVFGGYQIAPHVAVEVNYAALGTSRLVTNLVAGSPPVAGSVTLNRKITGFGADLLVSAPFASRGLVYGRLGVVRSSLDADALLNGAVVFTNGDTSERARRTTVTETVKRFGAGGEWMLGNGLGIRVDWERWLDVGKPFEIGGSGNTGEADTDFYSAGLVYHF